jgi:phage-related protein
MSFWGKNFVFNGTPSELYDLMLINFSTGQIESPGGAGIEIIDKKVLRKAKPYFYGAQQVPKLEFNLTIGSPNYVDGYTRNLIERWLFGQISYQKLMIMESDLDDCYFNCFLTDPSNTYIGNLNVAYTCKAICDAPWAWSYPKTYTQNLSGTTVSSGSFVFYNMSADNDYLYPTLSFSTNSVGNRATFTNETDNGRSFVFFDINANETISVDNDKQYLTSSTGLLRVSKFNKNWFRLLPGANIISYAGGLSTFSLTYQFAKKVGG